VFACGTGGTAAGLAIGNYLAGSRVRYIFIYFLKFYYTKLVASRHMY